MCALSILQDVCERTCSGEISVSELEEIQTRKGQMDKLCSAAATDDGHKDMPSISVLNANVNQRLKEFQYFQVYHQQLGNLISYLSSIQVQGKQFVFCVVNSSSYYVPLQILTSFTKTSRVSLIRKISIRYAPLRIRNAVFAASLMLLHWNPA